MSPTSEEIELQRTISHWLEAARNFQALQAELTEAIARQNDLKGNPLISPPGLCSVEQLEVLHTRMTGTLSDLLQDMNKAGGYKQLNAHTKVLSVWNRRIRRVLDFNLLSAS